MGIYDREYYRREGPSYLESLAPRGQATKWILFTTIGVYILQLLQHGGWVSGWLVESLRLEDHAVLAGQVWRLVTYAFLHADGTAANSGSNFWMHIFFNMWALWLFGGYVEEIYGRWEFLAFYLMAAAAGGSLYVALSLAHLAPSVPCVGASGAVMATTILCAFCHPRLTILLFFVLPVPIWVMAILLVALDVLGFYRGGGNTAFSVHLGGAAFAAFYYQTKIRILGIGDWLRSWKKRWSQPRLRLYRGDEEERRERVPVPPSGREIDEQLEAKVDAVLEKVARTGQDSLTATERELLLRASEIYKKRRT